MSDEDNNKYKRVIIQPGLTLIEPANYNIKDIIESLLEPGEQPTKVLILRLYHEGYKNKPIDYHPEFLYKILDWNHSAHILNFEINKTCSKENVHIHAIVWTNKSTISVSEGMDDAETIIIDKIPKEPKARIIEVVEDQCYL